MYQSVDVAEATAVEWSAVVMSSIMQKPSSGESAPSTVSALLAVEHRSHVASAVVLPSRLYEMAFLESLGQKGCKVTLKDTALSTLKNPAEAF